MPIPTSAQRVGANVRAEMARHRYSQQSIAKRLKMSQQALSRRLAGQIAFDVDELDLLADILSVSVTLLIATREDTVA